MKLSTFLFIIVYLVVFILGGYFFYTRYWQKWSATKDETITPQDTNQIYYAVGNNLYKINPEIANQDFKNESALRIQSTGAPVKMAAATANKLFFYQSQNPEGKSEIWQVDLTNNFSKKIFAKDISGLENFSDFYSPTLSADGKMIAVAAKHKEKDTILVLEVTTGNLKNALPTDFTARIGAVSWLADDKIRQLVFWASGKDIAEDKKVSFYTLDWQNQTLIKIISNEDPLYPLIGRKTDFLTNLTETINSQTTANIYSVNPAGEKQKITNFTFPKQITDFSISADGKLLLLVITDTQNRQTDIFMAQTDGQNLLQLTENGRAGSAVFSPDGKKVAFAKENDGIYTIGADKSKLKKILNLTDKTAQILMWR